MINSLLILSDTVTDSGSSFTEIWESIKGFFSDAIGLIKLLGDFVLHLDDYFVWLPSSIVSVILLTFSVLIILRIVGRSS